MPRRTSHLLSTARSSFQLAWMVAVEVPDRILNRTQNTGTVGFLAGIGHSRLSNRSVLPHLQMLRLLNCATKLLIVIAILSLSSTVAVESAHFNFPSHQKLERPQLVLQTGHALGVNCIAFAPNASWLVSAGADNSLILWQTSSGRQLRAFRGHHSSIRSLAVSFDGRWIASGGNDGAVKIWDVDSGQEVFSL
ncbi:MAG TPA: hypothetical protein VLB68_14760, partial [Pyrinomonadaceae bacterium]|nr:hypothetical protein [Pyrinomonadaceae bacterium]